MPAGLLDVFEELRGNVHGVHLPVRPHFLGEEAGEQPRPGPDVGHHHSRLHLAGGCNLCPVGEHLAALALKLLLEPLYVRVLERVVDPGFDTLFLGGDRPG